MKAQRKLSEFLEPPPRPSAIEVDRQWWEVRARLRRRSQLRRAAAVAAVVLGVGVSALLFRTPSSPEVWQGATVNSTTSAISVSLHEGTKIELQPHTQLQVALQSRDEVLLLLAEGEVRLDVVKNSKRRFIVRADDVDVQVVGTQFEVRRSSSQISVTVRRGIVEVHTGEQVHRLTAGESWSRGGLAEVDAESSLLEPEEDVAAPAPAPDTRRRVKRQRAPVVALPVAPVPAPAPIVPVVVAPVAAVATARTVFDAAVRARSKGDAKEAIARFEQLLLQWPDSTFVPLTAFELGRLQMDVRKDPRAAAAAFEKVLANAAGSSLAEDAQGRLVEAYASFDGAACRKARARYLSAFPNGTHAKDVSSACPP